MKDRYGDEYLIVGPSSERHRLLGMSGGRLMTERVEDGERFALDPQDAAVRSDRTGTPPRDDAMSTICAELDGYHTGVCAALGVDPSNYPNSFVIRDIGTLVAHCEAAEALSKNAAEEIASRDRDIADMIGWHEKLSHEVMGAATLAPWPHLLTQVRTTRADVAGMRDEVKRAMARVAELEQAPQRLRDDLASEMAAHLRTKQTVSELQASIVNEIKDHAETTASHAALRKRIEAQAETIRKLQESPASLSEVQLAQQEARLAQRRAKSAEESLTFNRGVFERISAQNLAELQASKNTASERFRQLTVAVGLDPDTAHGQAAGWEDLIEAATEHRKFYDEMTAEGRVRVATEHLRTQLAGAERDRDAAWRKLEEIKRRPFEFLHGLGFRAGDATVQLEAREVTPADAAAMRAEVLTLAGEDVAGFEVAAGKGEFKSFEVDSEPPTLANIAETQAMQGVIRVHIKETLEAAPISEKMKGALADWNAARPINRLRSAAVVARQETVPALSDQQVCEIVLTRLDQAEVMEAQLSELLVSLNASAEKTHKTVGEALQAVIAQEVAADRGDRRKHDDIARRVRQSDFIKGIEDQQDDLDYIRESTDGELLDHVFARLNHADLLEQQRDSVLGMVEVKQETGPIKERVRAGLERARNEGRHEADVERAALVAKLALVREALGATLQPDGTDDVVQRARAAGPGSVCGLPTEQFSELSIRIDAAIERRSKMLLDHGTPNLTNEVAVEEIAKLVEFRKSLNGLPIKQKLERDLLLGTVDRWLRPEPEVSDRWKVSKSADGKFGA